MSDWDETRLRKASFSKERQSATQTKAPPKYYSVLFGCTNKECRDTLAIASKYTIREDKISCEKCGGVMRRI